MTVGEENVNVQRRKRRKNRSEVRGILDPSVPNCPRSYLLLLLICVEKRTLFSANSSGISKDMRRQYYCTKKKKEKE